MIVVWRTLIRRDGSRGYEEKSPIHVYDVVRMMGQSQNMRRDSSARDDNGKCDDVVETDDSDNGPDGRWSTGESDNADSPKGYQTAKDRSPAWVKGQSRKRPSKSLVEALTGTIARADVWGRFHHERGHYTGSGSKFGGLITFAENQSSLFKNNMSNPQLKGSKQRTGTSSS